MSYLRLGQQGYYVDLGPNGSDYYLYNSGTDIIGLGRSWTHEQWAAMIGRVIDEISYTSSQPIKAEFESYYDGWDTNYNTIDLPESCEIFCQCVDRRIDTLELTDDLHTAVQQHVQNYYDH